MTQYLTNVVEVKSTSDSLAFTSYFTCWSFVGGFLLHHFKFTDVDIDFLNIIINVCLPLLGLGLTP